MADSRSRTSFIFGAASNWFAFAATLAVSFFLTPYLIGALGTARYDVWCVVESILAYFTLLDMGVAACLVRYVAKHHAQDDRLGLNRIASSCLALFLGAGLVALVLGSIVLMFFAPKLEAKIADSHDVLPFMLIMLANLAFTLPLSVFPSLLDGLERFGTKSIIRIAALALRTTGIVVMLNREGGLLPLAIVYTVCNLLEHGAMVLCSFRFLPGLKFARRFVDRETLHQVRTYSVDAFLAMLAGRISLQTGAIVIGLMLPAGQVTFFVTAARLIDYAKTLLRQITTTLTPGIAAREARGDMLGVRMLFLKATRWVLYIVLPVHVGLILFGKAFLARWVGPSFIEGSYPALLILSATLTLGVSQSVASRILYGLGRLRFFARLALVDAALNIVLLFALIQTWGVEGVAVAIAIPNVLFCIVVLVHVGRMLNVNLVEYLREWLRPAVAVLIPISIWLMLGEPAANWWEIFSSGIVGMLAYGVTVAVWEFGLPRLLKARQTSLYRSYETIQ